MRGSWRSEREPGDSTLWPEFWAQCVAGGESVFVRWLEARVRWVEEQLRREM
jgi:hypothetical protein